MNILVAAALLPRTQPTNAVPLVTHGLLGGLRSRHQVSLATIAGHEPGDRDAVAVLEAADIDVHAVWLPERSQAFLWKRRWRVATSWLRGRYPFRTIWFWEPSMQRLLDRLLTERRYDLVIAEDNLMGVYRYRTPSPVFLTEVEVRQPEDGCSLPEPDWIARMQQAERGRWLPYQRAVWKRFDRVQVFTRRDAQAFQAIAPELADRVRVNPFGVAASFRPDRRREEAGSVVFVGGFAHAPNVDAALWLGNEIMPLLRTLSPGARLMIVGSVPPSDVQALAGDDIVVTGHVAEVEPFLERAAVVVAPVRTGGGMRMKVLQGMALGKAVVTTPLGAQGLVSDGPCPPLVVAEGAHGIAHALAALLSSPGARHRLGDDARAFAARNHSPSAYAARVEAIYAELR